MATHAPVKSLDISGNSSLCGGTELGGFRKLCKIGLATSPALVNLDLSDCGIQAAHCQKFLGPALEDRQNKGGRRLKSLNVVGNPMCGSEEAISQVSMSVEKVSHTVETHIKRNTNVEAESKLMDWDKPNARQLTESENP